MKSRYYLIMLLAFVKCFTASAQGLDASPAGVMISHGHPKDGWMFSYTYMNMMMKNNLSGTSKISEDEIFAQDYSMSPQKMNMNMHMLMAMYGVTGRLSVMVMVNYNEQKMDMTAYSASMHTHGGSMNMSSTSHLHHTSGLGDVKLWGLYKLHNGEGSSWVASLGFSFPTGDYKIEAGEHATLEGEHHAYMMQLGTGSLDFMPGITYLKNKNKFTYSAQLIGVIRPFNNSLNYHWGNELNVNVWGAYKFVSWLSASLHAEYSYSGSISGEDNLMYIYTEPGTNPDNYGGTKINGYAGLNFYINKSFMRDSKIGVEFGLPVYQNLNGIQQSLSSTLFASITKYF